MERSLTKAKGFVKVVGKKRYSISQSEIGELVKAFEQAGYSSLNFLYRFNEQGMTVSDLPTTTTSIVLNGKEKRVVNYFGAPKKLFELEKTIERLAGLNALIGSPREARETPKPIPGKPFSLP
jgi:hypothetical protein